MDDRINKKKSGLVEIFSTCPFTILQENVIKFPNQQTMDNFFETSKLLKREYKNDTFGYNDKDGHITVDIPIELAEKCKYIRFRNEKTGGWYYAFILGSRKVNPKTSTIFFD